MSGKNNTFKITGTSPAAAGQAVLGAPVGGLDEYDQFFIVALLQGATGGTLDVYLQRQVLNDGSLWADWVHFPQLAAGAAAIKYSLAPAPGAAAPVVVGTTAADGTTGAPALAANTVVGGHPGAAVRCVCVAGVSTTLGQTITVYIKAQRASW